MRYILYFFTFPFMFFSVKKVFFSKKIFQYKTFFSYKNIFSANNVYFCKKHICFFKKKKKIFFNLVLQQMSNHSYDVLIIFPSQHVLDTLIYKKSNLYFYKYVTTNCQVFSVTLHPIKLKIDMFYHIYVNNNFKNTVF